MLYLLQVQSVPELFHSAMEVEDIVDGKCSSIGVTIALYNLLCQSNGMFGVSGCTFIE